MKKLLLAMMAILALVAARPAPASAYDEYYIVGGFTGWKFDPDNWKMTTDDGVTYTKENVTIEGGQEFKIATENWVHAYTTGKTDMENDTKYEKCIRGGENNNMAFSSKLENGKITIKIDTENTGDMENTIITIGDPGDEPDPVTPSAYIGDLKVKYGVGTKWNDGIDMDKDLDWLNNHKWYYSFTAEANTEFVIRDADSKDHKHATAFTKDNPLQFDYPYTLDGGHVDGDYSSGNNFVLKDAGKYTITVDASNKDAMTVTVSKGGSVSQRVDDWPEGAEKFVYFNAGFAWEREDRIAKGKIYAHFIRKGKDINGEDIKEPTDNDCRFEMKDNRDKEGNVNAMLPLFYAPVPENADDYDGVQFEAENGVVYNTKKCENYSKYDTEHWADFIFTADNSVGDSKTVFSAEQSVMTYEQYRVRRDDPAKEAIYYLGSNMKGRDGLKDSGDWFLTDFEKGEVGISQASEGVFMFQLKPDKSGEDIKFKMSWVNAKKRIDDYNAEYNRTGDAKLTNGDKRWWATYNLGLVGPTLAPVYGGDLKKAEDKVDYKPAEGTNGNAAMKYIPNRCRKYSRYCSYDWWIASDQIKDATYYVVVDTYYKTTALVSFEPKPKMASFTSGTFRKSETFSDEDAAYYGEQLKGVERHGSTLVKEANIADGNAVINTSGATTLWDKNYTLDYGVYYGIGDEQDEAMIISRFTGKKEAKSYQIHMDNLPYGEKVKVGVRCTYTDEENSKYKNEDGTEYVAKFRSFTDWKEDTKPVTTLTASIDENPKTIMFLEKGWNAHATANITVKADGEIAYYFDIDPDKNPCSIRFAEESDFHVQAAIGAAHYSKKDKNWATPRQDGAIAFVLENIHDPKDGIKEYDVTFTVQVPFVVGDVTPSVKWCDKLNGEGTATDYETAAPVKRRANEAAPATRIDFVPVYVEKAISGVGSSLSGINDVMADGDAEAEYFNLQGVRVQGDIVPGVYIVRRGATVTKEVVR